MPYRPITVTQIVIRAGSEQPAWLSDLIDAAWLRVTGRNYAFERREERLTVVTDSPIYVRSVLNRLVTTGDVLWFS